MSDKQQKIAELEQRGMTQREIAAELGISERTVRRCQKKAPAQSMGTDTSAEAQQSTSDYITENSDSSIADSMNDAETEGASAQDALKGRHFAYVIYPESAPEDWIARMQNVGIPFTVSPLHDKDKNPDGTDKKPHWHMIVSWGNSTTYRSARALCDMLRCPRPQLLKSPTGMYRYFQHKDNPEKYQYTEMPQHFLGWQRPLEDAEVEQLIDEITDLLYLRDCTEYGELLAECRMLGREYEKVARNHTIYFSALCRSYRHAPVRILLRVYNAMMDKPEQQERIAELLTYYQGKGGQHDESND